MAIAYSPRVGELLECDFGDFLVPPLRPIFNGRISPEIRKRRLCIVLNGKLPNGCVMVVPVSSSGNANAVQRGIHVLLPQGMINVTNFYDNRDRWAIAECLCSVSKQRLFKLPQGVAGNTSREFVELVQRAVIKTVNAASLLAPAADNSTNS